MVWKRQSLKRSSSAGAISDHGTPRGTRDLAGMFRQKVRRMLSQIASGVNLQPHTSDWARMSPRFCEGYLECQVAKRRPAFCNDFEGSRGQLAGPSQSKLLKREQTAGQLSDAVVVQRGDASHLQSSGLYC